MPTGRSSPGTAPAGRPPSRSSRQPPTTPGSVPRYRAHPPASAWSSTATATTPPFPTQRSAERSEPGGPLSSDPDYTSIRLEVEGAVATITLDRPKRLNAFTNTMRHELIDAFDRTDADDAVR